MHASNPNDEDEEHRVRSQYVRGIVQGPPKATALSSACLATPPKRIVQFWNDLGRLPGDVEECIQSWKRLEEESVAHLVFDDRRARGFIRKSLGVRYGEAYNRCYHPAMQSDYFRLCYLVVEGGCYVDADDVYRGAGIERVFSDGRLKLQPLCYDTATDQMVPPAVFTEPGANAESWIFYFNNNPLIAAPSHPIVERALANATMSLERGQEGGLPEIQSTTGPGNLTKSVVDGAAEQDDVSSALLVLHDWEEVATSRWPLSYRHDERNWRLSNRRQYRQ